MEYREKRRQEEELAKAKVEKDTPEFWRKLRAAVEAKGHKVELEENPKGHPGRFFKVDDCRVSWSLVPEKVHQHVTGKLQLMFGSYSDRRVFKQSQARAGDFDYDAIVFEMEHRVVRFRENRAEKAREEAALDAGGALRDKLVREFYPALKDKEGPQSVPQGEPVHLQSSSEGGLKLVVSRPLNEDQLRELLTTCRKVGLIR